MDRTRFRRLMDAVGAAMEFPPAEREACLVRACQHDQTLLDEARELLLEATTTSLGAVTARLEGAIAQTATNAEETPLPRSLGPYRIVRKLGGGGMGIVYLAHQEQPLRRDVAIKVIRAALADREAIARFSIERQALARMEHPAIARVYDARTTDDGLPYFVMELVDGLPITEYCDRERFPLDERLVLFREVCAAVHHAHLRGVIHRDLKPSNVLVNRVDGRPMPKVIDFGVAKAIGGIMAGESLQTRAGSLIGTLDYMSPEQVRGLQGDVDVRSDVYSLGVILYELVCGRHPLAVALLRKVGLIEAQRIIAETEPPRPSTSLTSLAEAAESAQQRATDLNTLRRRLREDLDWIVMKALDKDRERRYQSALELALDLERYADHRPVSAKPPTVWYRTRKFMRRHRTGAAAAAVVAIALVSGGAMAGTGFLRARAEAHRAEAISGFLSDLLASVQPDQSGRVVTVREVLEKARQQILAGDFVDDPETRASLALVIGHSYEGLGHYNEALELLKMSAELRRNLHDPDDERVRASLYRLGTVLWKQGALSEALTIRLSLVEMIERTVGTAHADYPEALSNVGNTYADMGNLDLAAENLRRAVEAGRRITGREGELALARFINNLGTVYLDRRDYKSAITSFREALAIRARLLGEESDVYAITLVNLGNALTDLGELKEGEQVAARAVALHERIFGAEHPRTAAALGALAEAFTRNGRAAEAEPLIRRTLAIRTATSGSSYWRVANEHRKLAEIFLATGRLSEAEVELLKAWEGLTKAGETSHPAAQRVAETMARVQTLMKKEGAAQRWLKRAASSGRS